VDWHTGSPAHTALVGFFVGVMQALIDWIRPWRRAAWRRLWRRVA
jgi:hypothetical protein